MNKKIKVEVIEKYLSENNLTKQKFCKMCRISSATLNRILQHNVGVRFLTLLKIARTIKISTINLYTVL